MTKANSIIIRAKGLTYLEAALLKTRLKAAGLDFESIIKKHEKK